MQEDSTNQSNIRKDKFLLFIGANVSEFVHLYKFMNDTAIRRFTTDDQVISYLATPQANIPNALYRIYKNYPKGKLTFTDHIPSDTYRFEEDLDLFHWQLTGDTATVCGYKSQKATCNFGGRSWVAWFAPELPHSDGPYKFNGLPGLILKIADTRNHYVFEMTEIQKPGAEVMIDIEDKNYIVTTKQGFFRAFDSFINDFVTRARQSGPGNDLQTVTKNMASRNNPIELIRK
jgi:GLPGLI family protein